MATINRFEDLEIWQLARKQNKELWLLTMRQEFSKLFSLNDQLRSASISVMNNISEGFERDGNREFIQFLSYAKGSAGEVKNMLYGFIDIGLISHEEFDQLTKQAETIRVKIFKLMEYLNRSDYKGSKFKKV